MISFGKSNPNCLEINGVTECIFLRFNAQLLQTRKNGVIKMTKHVTPKRFIEIHHRFCGSGVKFGPPTSIFSQKVL